MSDPLFKVQIVHADDGIVAVLPSGKPLECDLLACCEADIVKRLVVFSAQSLQRAPQQRGLWRRVRWFFARHLGSLAARLGRQDGSLAQKDGLFCTEAQVRLAIRHGFQEVIQGLKDETHWAV